MASPPGSEPLLALLSGAVVQRADAGSNWALLKLREPGRTTFLLAVAGRGAGLAASRPPKPEGSRSVGRLEGFRLAWLRDRVIGLERGELRAKIDATRGTRVELKFGPEAWNEADRALPALEEDRDAWLARGEDLAGDQARDELVAKRASALRAVRGAIARIGRRVEAVRGDLARIGDADALAQRAQWLVAEAARAPRGARSLAVTDWSTGEAKTIEVPLDPSKPARAQVEAMFQRARRLKHGAKVAGERLAQAEAALAALAPLEGAIVRAEDAAAIDEALAAARAAAPKDLKGESFARPGARPALQAKSPPYRTFHARNGARLLVGRGAAQNDLLTFQVARPHDLWLHAQGFPGAHVVVPLPKNQSCPGDVLADAAHLAAHFSGARDEAVVEVAYASRRHLRKPRGSAPGLVVVDREKVIAVRIEPSVLRTLLESEEG
jgi:fibronectin-binding protein A (FbpA)/ribosomal quality control pathway NFACT family protein